MPEFNLLKIDGKPLEKLIEVISQGIGKVYNPRGIRKEADAKAYEIEIIERAKSKAVAEGKIIDLDTYERIQERLIFKETKRQQNIDNVSQIAVEQLSQENTVSEEPVNEDWTTRFFNIVEDVSDEEMQKLWGRILAGEVKQPNSYSLRTLELLKNLTKQDAEVFTNAATFAITSNNSPFIYRGLDNAILDKNGLTFENRLLLIEIGILQSETNISRAIKKPENNYVIYFECGKYLIRASKKANTPDNKIEIFRFTKIGEELLNLLIPNSNEEYIKDFYFKLESQGLDLSYAFILNKVNKQYNHSPWMEFGK